MVSKDTTGPWDGQSSDEEQDTEGHGIMDRYPVPPNVDGGDGDGGLGRRGADEASDTEGHLQFQRRPGEGKVAPESNSPDPSTDDEPDTEGHFQFRRRPGEGGE